MTIACEINFLKSQFELRYFISNFFQWKCVIGFYNNFLCTIAFGLDSNALLSLLRVDFPNATLIETDLSRQALQILRYVENSNQIPLDMNILLGGTEFQNKVWLLLQNISWGETKNYQFISRQLGLQNGDRAVGHAISQNPIAFLIPCHRIIGKDGSLKNFKWGTDLKLFLLRKEGMKFETSLF